MPEEEKFDAEKAIKRNPHPDFKKVEASRPPWSKSTLEFTQTAKTNWKLGDGANDGGESLKKNHVEIDPYEEGRPATFNYKLLISAIVPRPIGFCGKTTNLAPFSYFNVINHDPPLFTIGFAGGYDRAKDTLKNILETKECSMNIISEHILEAANSTSINSPYGTSEWVLSGLTPGPCKSISAPRVAESIFSIEGKLYSTQEFESRATPGKKTGVLAIVEGVKFWAREDAINAEKNLVDPTVLRPMSRMGGITYGRTIEAVELPRPDFGEMTADGEAERKGLLKGKSEKAWG
ncbi:hypothetical protein FKW77_000444 [Venturia effusa]|uniref:Flavin reductase like domain-containing protein n=1 Tax=Venturia effusa TaxID=50376 RepID=A0A517LPC5_9PEZI|nr:hypothetical protein FKW77_000444 [Venturia effusa]